MKQVPGSMNEVRVFSFIQPSQIEVLPCNKKYKGLFPEYDGVWPVIAITHRNTLACSSDVRDECKGITQNLPPSAENILVFSVNSSKNVFIS